MSEREEGVVEELVGAPSLLQRFRLPLIVAGAAAGMIMCLLMGLALGLSKRNADRKLFASQVEAIKQQGTSAESERKILEAKVESYRLTADNRKTELVELRDKLACFEAAASQAMAAEQADLAKQLIVKPVEQTSKTVAPPKGKTEAPPPKTGYVRFGNTSCTLIAGKSEEWKACLKLGTQAGGAAKPVEASAVKVEEKPVTPAGKPADPHAKPVDSHAKPAH